MNKLHTLVAVIGIAVAGAVAYRLQNKPGGDSRAAAAVPAAADNGARAASGGSGGSGGPVAVEVGRVEKMVLQDETQAVGTLRSRQGVMLRPEVSGRIAKIGFADGQRVRRGQMLVQLDDTLQQAQLQQAKAQASIARTNLQRNRELVAQNFVSQSAADQTAAALEVAEAQVALAQAQLGRMRIVAAFDGVAGISNVSTGDYVKDGADLVNIEDVGTMLVDFRLPERVLARLKPGQAVDVSLDGLPGQTYKGQVEALDSQVDANGRSLLVRAKLDNPGGVLRPGMFARARIVFDVRANALVVPEEALVPQGGKQYIVKLVDGPTGPVTQRIEARLGMRVLGKAEILDGLKAGDTIVTAGQSRLMRADGMPVKVVEIGGGGAKGTGRTGAAASGTVLAPSAAASGASAV
jgi:membrane fusion protein (multidrug efflux system)